MKRKDFLDYIDLALKKVEDHNTGLCYVTKYRISYKAHRVFTKLFKPTSKERWLFGTHYSYWMQGHYQSTSEAKQDRLIALEIFKHHCLTHKLYKEF